MKVNFPREVQQFACATSSAQHVTLFCGWGFVGSSRSGGRQRQGTLVPMNMDRCRSEHAHAGGRERILWCLTHAFSGLQYKKIRPILCNLLKSIFSISLFLTFSPKFNIGHNFTVDWIPLPKRLNDNSVEMYISKHSLLNIYIFVTPILQKKSCEYRRTIESGAVSGNWDTEWRVAVTLSLTLSLVISICLPAPMFQCFGRNFEIGCTAKALISGIRFNCSQIDGERYFGKQRTLVLLHVRFVRCWADPDHFSVLYYISPCELVLYPASGWSAIIDNIIDIQLDELVYSGQSAQWQFLFYTLWSSHYDVT